MESSSNTLQHLKQLPRVLSAAMLMLLLSAFAVSVHAAETRNGLNELSRPAAGNSFTPTPGISIEKATAIARKHTGGRVLSATPKQRSSGTEYRIRMLVDGERVITVVVDHKGRIKNRR